MLSRLDACLKQAASPEAPFGCCLVYGQERYPVSYLLSSLKKILQRQENITVEQYDYSQVSLAEILPHWDGLSLFAEKKIILLTYLDGLRKNDAALLSEWLDSQHDGSGIFLFCTATKVDGRSPFFKSMKKYGEVVRTDRLPPAQAGRLVACMLRSMGSFLPPESLTPSFITMRAICSLFSGKWRNCPCLSGLAARLGWRNWSCWAAGRRQAMFLTWLTSWEREMSALRCGC